MSMLDICFSWLLEVCSLSAGVCGRLTRFVESIYRETLDVKVVFSFGSFG